jgi:lipopolysaccharide/colanic/teichoic acid biosynthesis glycosyltransferase
MLIRTLAMQNSAEAIPGEARRLQPFVSGFYAQYGKRAMDIFSAATGLVLLAPVFGFVACCIKLTSRGPVFYRQLRIGKDGRTFRILKFRSMVEAASEADLRITVAGDSRVTPVGMLLRRYKVDELPQLWNVVRGEMSLVGPRPEVPEYVANYSAEQRRVLSARPGITDPASLAYRHEEEILAQHGDPELCYRTQILPDKLALNRDYLEKITLRGDLRIILQTIAASLVPAKSRDAQHGR